MQAELEDYYDEQLADRDGLSAMMADSAAEMERSERAAGAPDTPAAPAMPAAVCHQPAPAAVSAGPDGSVHASEGFFARLWRRFVALARA